MIEIVLLARVSYKNAREPLKEGDRGSSGTPIEKPERSRVVRHLQVVLGRPHCADLAGCGGLDDRVGGALEADGQRQTIGHDVITFGVLLDTLPVRTVLVPALALELGLRIWWPSALARCARPAASVARSVVDFRPYRGCF